SMMFRGAYTDEFYRALHDALHTQVDAWHSGHNGETPIRQNHEYSGRSVDQMWAQVIQLEKTCRNSDPTMLEALSTDSLVQLQPAPGFAHGCSSIEGSGND
ncbi:MAG: hypothetical protein WCC37_08250, partial [Candidatus Sulfotelmatobacter sp.]